MDAKMIRTKLISVLPWEEFQRLEAKLGVDLNDCKGAMEIQNNKEVWYGFVNHLPMRFTYRSSDHKSTFAKCNNNLVKTKLKELNQ
jgi:hypothetical protein